MDYLNGPKLYHLDRSLPERRVLKLDRARGARIVSVAGDVWITEDGRYDDVVLASGESTVLERNGTAMITTFGSADVEVVLPVAADAATSTHLTIDPATLERHIRAAQRMRAQAMGTMFADAVDWVRAKLRPAAPRVGCCA